MPTATIRDATTTNNNWNINGARSGDFSDGTTTTAFSNINNVTGGGTASDNFTLATLDFSGLINGGAGSDSVDITAAGNRTIELGNRTNANQNIVQIETLTANADSNNTLISDSAAATNNWNINGARAGDVMDGTTLTAFNNINNVSGTTTIDNFTLAATNFAGLITGGMGNDRVDITAAGNRTIELGNRTTTNQNLYQIETLNANAASSNTLIGDGTTTNSWNINEVRAGDVTDGTTLTNYTNIDQVTGGARTDNFNLATNNYAGIINGGGGSDTLTIVVSGNQIIEIGNRNNANINVDRVETIIVNNTAAINELIGDSSATLTTWTINGRNAGLLNDGTNSVRFSNVTDLTGSGGTDNFLITGDATSGLTGVIDGMGGTDSLTITASGDRIIEIGNRSGGALESGRQYTYRLETITNRAEANELISDRTATANAWRVTGTNSGTVTGSLSAVSFDNFATLTEGRASADFVVEQSASVNVLNGGVGNDTYTLFGNVQTLNAGNGADTITLNSGGNVSTLNAGDGADTITFNTGASADTVNGDGGDDRFFILANLSNATFNGGAGDDDFSVAGATASALFIANVRLNGDGGNDRFEVGALTTSLPEASMLTIVGGANRGGLGDTLGSTVAGFELTLGDSGAVAGVTATEIETVSAIDGILNARDGTTTTWTINGVNAGEISDSGTGGSSVPESLTFSGFVTLNGGSGVDNFNVNTNGSIAGAITGGDNQDQLNIDLNGRSTQSGQINFNGGNDADTITINGTATDEVYTAGVNAGTNDQLAYALPGATFDVNYAAVETVTSNVVATTLTINNSGNATDTVSLGNDVFAATTSVANVNYQITDKTNITVRALGQSNLNLTDRILLPSGDFTLTANAINDTRTDTTLPLISANRLILDDVNEMGSATNGLTTDVNELSVINHSGEIYIVEQNGIELTDISNSSGVIVITTVAGSITSTSTANLSTSGTLNLTAATDIRLSGNNQLSGALTLNGLTVNVNNDTATNLASVNVGDLTITSLGNITDTGAIVVNNSTSTALARFTSTNGSITLTNAANNFDTVNLQAANDANLTVPGALTINGTTVGGTLNVTANGNLTVGDLTAETMTLQSTTGAIVDASSALRANAVTLTAVSGIGGGTVSHVNGSEGFGNLDTTGAINTQTATLSAINTTAGTVNINNSGALNVRDLRNRGDIILRNSGDMMLQVTQNAGASIGAIDANYGGDITATTYAGSVVILNDSSNSVRTAGVGLSEVDVTAQSLFVNSVRDFGEQGQPIRLRVNNQFTLIGSRGVVISIGGDPRNTTTTSGLVDQQRVDIGSLANIDPAIFAEVRNYNYSDTSLRLPPDQRTASEEDEEEALEEEV